MEIIRLRRGKVGIELDKESQAYLLNMMAVSGETCQSLAQQIGIGYDQLYKPLTGRRNCSPESYRKIVKFIERDRNRKARQLRKRKESGDFRKKAE